MREELLRGAFISWLVVGVLSNFWGELLAGGAAGKPPKHGGGESTQHARLHSLCAKTATSFEFATEPVTKIQPIDLHNPINKAHSVWYLHSHRGTNYLPTPTHVIYWPRKVLVCIDLYQLCCSFSVMFEQRDS